MSKGPVSLGTVHVSGSVVTGGIGDAVTDRMRRGGEFTAVVEAGTPLATLTPALQAAVAARQQLLGQEAAIDQLSRVVSQGGVTAVIDQPSEGETIAAGSKLVIAAEHAQRNFVAPVLGVPPRLRVFINNVEYLYSPREWYWEFDRLTFTASLMPAEVGLPPVAVRPTLRAVRRLAGPQLARPAPAAASRLAGLWTAIGELDTSRWAMMLPIGNGGGDSGDGNGVPNEPPERRWPFAQASIDPPDPAIVTIPPGFTTVQVIAFNGTDQPPTTLLRSFYLARR